MAQIKIGGTTLDDKHTAIAVPVTGKNNKEIEEQMGIVVKHAPDVIEIRADYYESLYEKNKLTTMLDNIKNLAGGIPILFTIRTANEGGEANLSYETYKELLLEVALSGYVDAIDVEGFINEDAKNLVGEIKNIGVNVIASYHDFNGTPGQTELVKRIGSLKNTGADVVKVAVMPNKPKDVLNLLEATWGAKERYQDTLMITMSMGTIGMISRISGVIFGSCLSFASVGKSSAPGQLDIDELRTFLNHLQ